MSNEQKKLFRKGKSEENSQSRLFILMLAVMTLLIGLSGYFIFNSSYQDRDKVKRESQLYEQAKNQKSQTGSNNSTDDLATTQDAQLSESSQPNVVGTALIFFAKYTDRESEAKQLASVERNIYQGSDPVSSAIEELIAGPSSEEQSEGYLGGINLVGDSNCGNLDYKITSEEGSIKIQFCKTYQDNGILGSQLSRLQIIKTLSGISGQPNVYVLDKSGKCLFDKSLSGC